MYQRILLVSFLYTSLTTKFTLAARARAAEHTRARRGAAAARPAICVERLANLPLLAGLGRVVVQSGISACSGHLPAMLNRWLGWLSSSEPVPDPTESITPQALAAGEASSDEEALLGTHPVPQGAIAAAHCLPCVDQAGEIEPRKDEEGTSSGSEDVSHHQPVTAERHCLFAVLKARNGGITAVSCVRDCRGRSCGHDNGHMCSEGPGALGGGTLKGHDRAESDRLRSIDAHYAQTWKRCWRREWGPRMSVDQLITTATHVHKT